MPTFLEQSGSNGTRVTLREANQAWRCHVKSCLYLKFWGFVHHGCFALILIFFLNFALLFDDRCAPALDFAPRWEPHLPHPNPTLSGRVGAAFPAERSGREASTGFCVTRICRHPSEKATEALYLYTKHISILSCPTYSFINLPWKCHQGQFSCQERAWRADPQPHVYREKLIME